MSKRKSYDQLEKEIQTLIARQQSLADDSIKIIEKRLFTKEIKSMISSWDDKTLRAVAKKMADYLKTVNSRMKSTDQESKGPNSVEEKKPRIRANEETVPQTNNSTSPRRFNMRDFMTDEDLKILSAANPVNAEAPNLTNAVTQSPRVY